MMRIILDTNVFISGIFWKGAPYQILKAWSDRKIKLVISQEILNEYGRVANALSKKYPQIDLTPFIELLTIYTDMHVAVKFSERVSRDSDDDKFIECAISAGVEIIVSGDQDLLTISGFQNIKVIKPADFSKIYLEGN